jgi:hypothetical protein
MPVRGQATNGNSSLAVALGTFSQARAFGLPLPGNDNIAGALGIDLTALAIGSGVTDIVTFLGTL